MDELSQLLARLAQGETGAAEMVFSLVYDELKQMASIQMARERPGVSLQSTALVHELYLRLLGGDQPLRFENRRHFFAAASEAMRRILVEAARRRQTTRRGGHLRRRELLDTEVGSQREIDPASLLAVHELLEQFAAEYACHAEVVKLRYFLGCTFVEIGEILSRSADAVRDDWSFARAWLKRSWAKSQPSAD